MKNVFFILAVLLSVTAYSQQASYHEDALRYLELNGTEKQYSTAIDEMYAMLQQQYRDKNVPESVWQELANDKTSALTNIKSLLISAYRSNFSHDDIKELITFYETAAGKQAVLDITALDEDQKLALNTFYASEVGQKVQTQGEDLKEMVSEVSEFWSRDLYRETIVKLEAEGY